MWRVVCFVILVRYKNEKNIGKHRMLNFRLAGDHLYGKCCSRSCRW